MLVSMLPLDVPSGTTLESLVTEVIPALHKRLVSEGGPDEAFVVSVRVEGRGGWTIRIRGREMRVREGEEPRPTLWMCMTEAAAERFLEDAMGPKRLLPKFVPGIAHDTSDGARPLARKLGAGTVLTMSDPRFIKRVAMASGRIELAVLDEAGDRMAVVFGFGDAARRAIDPTDPDTVAEAPIATLERVLRGERGPQEAIASGEVAVRGSRLLAMQLALAVAPFCPPAR